MCACLCMNHVMTILYGLMNSHIHFKIFSIHKYNWHLLAAIFSISKSRSKTKQILLTPEICDGTGEISYFHLAQTKPHSVKAYKNDKIFL